MSYNEELQGNNALLQEILAAINALPEAESLDEATVQLIVEKTLALAQESGEFDGEDGRGIVSITRTSGTGTAGTTDTYTITYTDGSTSAFQVRNGSDGADGRTPVRGEDYWTAEDVAAMQADNQAYILEELAQRGQVEPLFAESAEWLEANGDKSKIYVLPDGMLWAWMLVEKEVSAGPGYTNALDGTTMHINQRWSRSSKTYSTANGYMTTDPIPVAADQMVYVNLSRNAFMQNYARIIYLDANSNYVSADDSTSATRIDIATDDAGVSSWKVGYECTTVGDMSTYTRLDGADSITHMIVVFNIYYHLSDSGGGSITEADCAGIILSVGNPIEEGGTEVVWEYDWASTGHAFVPADYEDRIVELERQSAEHAADIADLKNGITSTTTIKDWDAPIYDANIPIFRLSAEKAAMTGAANTPDGIYAMYDALMAKHPRYITRTDLGLCSDGVNHVYRYDFREPDPHYESGKVWSETKAKAVIVTGIHYEWAGIYAMYNALEEIADNPELRSFRRNTHLIVVPCANPYATIADNYQSGLATPNSYGVRNANGVEIHRNFEVDWVLTEEGSTHYGGPEPLSEVETQYIDSILKSNTDAALFLSCHNCGVDTYWGTGFIWASTATKYMCNMGFRLVDKLSDAWMDEYGDVLSAGIAEYKTDLMEDGDTRLGWAGLSSSPGTEAKQATKYGIQGTNVEICDPFQIHGTKASPEPSMSAFTMSRGAEVYANFLLTALGVYDPKDKKEYTPAEV